MGEQNPTRRAKPGDNIYEHDLLQIAPAEDGTMPFDCDGCGYFFKLVELRAFAEPFLNRGQQWGAITCPKCGHGTKVTFAADSTQ